MLLFKRFATTAEGRRKIDHWKMHAPVIGKVFRLNMFGQFARTLSTLLINGVPATGVVGGPSAPCTAVPGAAAPLIGSESGFARQRALVDHFHGLPARQRAQGAQGPLQGLYRPREAGLHGMAFVTRFAPSPTGPLHLGHAYSAILAHDRARQHASVHFIAGAVQEAGVDEGHA